MLPFNFSLNAVLIVILGVVFLIGGAYFTLRPWSRMLGLSMVATAVGCICCGLTDGFTDPTPRGSMLKRAGGAALLVGVPVMIYSAYKTL